MAVDFAPEGEPLDGFTPLELLLASLAGCSGQVVVGLLKRMGQEVKDLTVHAVGTKKEVHPKVLTSIELDFEFRGGRIDGALDRKGPGPVRGALLPRLGHDQGGGARQGDLPAPRRLTSPEGRRTMRKSVCHYRDRPAARRRRRPASARTMTREEGTAVPNALVVKAAAWTDTLDAYLPALGHRNWIVVADSAFPLQISPGIETIVTGEDHFTVLEKVLKAVDGAKHVRPKIWLDKELAFVTEDLAPGVDDAKPAAGRGPRGPGRHARPPRGPHRPPRRGREDLQDRHGQNDARGPLHDRLSRARLRLLGPRRRSEDAREDEVKREFYSDSIAGFLASSVDEIVGNLTQGSDFPVELSQRNAWIEEIEVLQPVL